MIERLFRPERLLTGRVRAVDMRRKRWGYRVRLLLHDEGLPAAVTVCRDAAQPAVSDQRIAAAELGEDDSGVEDYPEAAREYSKRKEETRREKRMLIVASAHIRVVEAAVVRSDFMLRQRPHR